jgi:hypothetical protein
MTMATIPAPNVRPSSAGAIVNSAPAYPHRRATDADTSSGCDGFDQLMASDAVQSSPARSRNRAF